jgi:aromatic ring-opening dioxygenase LigB subunit
MEQITIHALMPHPTMMIPEIGKDEFDKIKDTVVAVEEAARIIKGQNPQTIIVVTPHGPVFEDSASISIHPRLKGNFGAFGAPDIMLGFETDGLLVRHILRQTDRLGINLNSLTDDMAKNHRLSLELDHGALVPLYYLSKAGFKGQLIHISVGMLSYEEMYTFGKAVQIAVGMAGKRVSVIASGDLSHSLTSDGSVSDPLHGREFDTQVLQAVKELNVKALLTMNEDLIKTNSECGLRSIFFLMGVVGGTDATAELLSYEAPLGVGYGVAVVTVKNKPKKVGK